MEVNQKLILKTHPGKKKISQNLQIYLNLLPQNSLYTKRLYQVHLIIKKRMYKTLNPISKRITLLAVNLEKSLTTQQKKVKKKPIYLKLE